MPNRLTGVRLGRRERWLLGWVPDAESIGGLSLEAPDAWRQQTLLRASRKLERCGLLERHQGWKAVRVRDPRRERPLFDRGRFWVRDDTSRRHFSRRVVVWTTPFGDGIKAEFRVELDLERPIRWVDRRVAYAERQAESHPLNPGLHEARVARCDERRDPLLRDEEQGYEGRREYLPQGVRAEEEVERWRLAARIARKTHPNLGSARLLEAAVTIHGSSTSTGELRTQITPRRRAPREWIDPVLWWGVDVGD